MCARRRAGALAAVALAAAACGAPRRDWQSASAVFPGVGNAFAELHAADGRSVGDVRLRTVAGAVEAEADLFRLAPGAHRLLVTSSGACTGTSLGGVGVPVGAALPLGRRPGERGVPFQVDGEGGARFRFELQALRVSALFDLDGSAIALTTSGGAPIACGVVRR